jgi:hypothetical protein
MIRITETNNLKFDLVQVGEIKGTQITKNQYVPGRIYYLNVSVPKTDLNQEEVQFLSNGKDYYDIKPVGLCLYHENWKEFSIFINFKVIPPLILNNLINSYFNIIKQYGYPSLLDKENKLIDLEKRSNLDLPFYFITSKQLSDLVGIKLSYSINKYKVENIITANLIDWDKIGFLINSRVTFDGILPFPPNIEKIYNTFVEETQ